METPEAGAKVPKKIEATQYDLGVNEGSVIEVDGAYYRASELGTTLTLMGLDEAKTLINQNYPTKEYSYDGDVVTITISDGTVYVHPRSAIETPEVRSVYVPAENKFITLTELDALIEFIPL